jgi:hypothetical protein
MLRSPTRRQAESRRQKALGSPGRVAKIDKALTAGPDLSDEQIAEVKTLRDKGESLHNAGKHGKAVATLAQALDILKAKKKSSGYRY